MEKQSGPFGRMRNWRARQATQSTNYQQPAYNSQANFNPVQSQASSINRVRSSIQNTGTAQPAIPQQNATIRPYQNTTGTMQNTPQNTTTQPRPQVKSTQPSAFYRQNMTAINQLNDFSKFTPDLIQDRLQEAVRRGEVSEQESQMLLNTFTTRYNQWQKRPRGTVETRPAAPIQPVVRNQKNPIDTQINNLNSDINAFTNENAWDTRPLGPNGMNPMYAGPGAAIFNKDIPVQIPTLDENNRMWVNGSYLTPEQAKIYQQRMADEVVARENDQWNKTRIRTGGKPPKPVEFSTDVAAKEKEKIRRKEYADRKAYVEKKRQAIAERNSINEAAEQASSAPMPMAGVNPNQEAQMAQRAQEQREQQVVKKQKALSGRFVRMSGKNYDYMGGAATPQQLADREQEARNWLLQNPNHPNARFIRKAIRELDESRGVQSPQVVRR